MYKEKKKSQTQSVSAEKISLKNDLTIAAQPHGKGIGELPLHIELNLIPKHFLKSFET